MTTITTTNVKTRLNRFDRPFAKDVEIRTVSQGLFAIHMTFIQEILELGLSNLSKLMNFTNHKSKKR